MQNSSFEESMKETDITGNGYTNSIMSFKNNTIKMTANPKFDKKKVDEAFSFKGGGTEGNQEKFNMKDENMNEQNSKNEKQMELEINSFPSLTIGHLKAKKNSPDDFSMLTDKEKQIKSIYMNWNDTRRAFSSFKIRESPGKSRPELNNQPISTKTQESHEAMPLRRQRYSIEGSTEKMELINRREWKGDKSRDETNEENNWVFTRRSRGKMLNTICGLGENEEKKNKLCLNGYRFEEDEKDYGGLNNKKEHLKQNTIYHHFESTQKQFYLPIAPTHNHNPWNQDTSKRFNNHPYLIRNNNEGFVDHTKYSERFAIKPQKETENEDKLEVLMNKNRNKDNVNWEEIPHFEESEECSEPANAPKEENEESSFDINTSRIIKPEKNESNLQMDFNNFDPNFFRAKYHPKSEFLNNVDTTNFCIKKYNNGVYFGELGKDGLKHGLGVIFYFNGRCYEGNFIYDEKEGKGFEYYQDGSTYSGEFENGFKEGKGIFEWSNGEIYDGQWSKGRKNGSGMWKSPSGDSYLGEWKNGRIEGFGVLIEKKGDRYEGEFKNSMKNGFGTERYSNGSTYIGEFLKNKPNGEGELYESNGDYFKGSFINGLKHGIGYLKTINEETFEGEFRNGKKCGFGKHVDIDGNKYNGSFENDLKHGYGEEANICNAIKKGYWINGKYVEQEMETIVEDDLDRQDSIAFAIEPISNNKLISIEKPSNQSRLPNSKEKKTILSLPTKKPNHDKSIEKPEPRNKFMRNRFTEKKETDRKKWLPVSPPGSKTKHCAMHRDSSLNRTCGCQRKH